MDELHQFSDYGMRWGGTSVWPAEKWPHQLCTRESALSKNRKENQQGCHVLGRKREKKKGTKEASPCEYPAWPLCAVSSAGRGGARSQSDRHRRWSLVWRSFRTRGGWRGGSLQEKHGHICMRRLAAAARTALYITAQDFPPFPAPNRKDTLYERTLLQFSVLKKKKNVLFLDGEEQEEERGQITSRDSSPSVHEL